MINIEVNQPVGDFKSEGPFRDVLFLFLINLFWGFFYKIMIKLNVVYF